MQALLKLSDCQCAGLGVQTQVFAQIHQPANHIVTDIAVHMFTTLQQHSLSTNTFQYSQKKKTTYQTLQLNKFTVHDCVSYLSFVKSVEERSCSLCWLRPCHETLWGATVHVLV